MTDELRFTSRINDTLVFIENTIKIGLADTNKDRMLDRAMKGFDEALPNILIGQIIETTFDDVVKKLKLSVKIISRSKIDNYERWVLNHGLIMICGVFEDYLYHLLDEILSKNPQLHSWLTKEEILQSYQSAKRSRKLRDFYSKKLKIKEKDFFDFEMFTDDIKNKYENYNFDKLIRIFKLRDKAAHTDEFVLNSYPELEDIGDLFNKLIWILSLKAREKWSVKSKVVEAYNISKKAKP